MYNQTYIGGRTPRYIVIHYTSTNASAEANIKYFSTGNRNASADIFVNKDGSYKYFNNDMRNYYTWHVGDGNGRYGITNPNSIGIEVVSAGEEYTEAQKRALREIVGRYMAEFGIPASNVVRHYDASRKICPATYCGNAENNRKWNALHEYITGGQEEDVMASKEEVVKGVWQYQIGEESDMKKKPLEAWQRLSWINTDSAALVKELLRTDDAANDKTTGTIYRRICFIDKRVREMETNMTKILEKLDKIEKSGK